MDRHGFGIERRGRSIRGAGWQYLRDACHPAGSWRALPDGTVVTFTELYNGTQTTVDVPLKRGIAQAEMPAYSGAKISAATGVVLGNEIRWGGQ